MPKSLIAWITLLSLLLMSSASIALRDRMKHRHRHRHNYQKVDPQQSLIEETSSTATYQNSSDYALPPKQKVVTYCVVDGRLIDK
mmetsp:Transcript_40694/g.45467  ORF Transcript_40694/g.45467 Transcript_40694/m.45467 type:complete len:85 (+) Transcript_40694:1818-2072(+)